MKTEADVWSVLEALVREYQDPKTTHARRQVVEIAINELRKGYKV
jgi:hypothetical protein